MPFFDSEWTSTWIYPPPTWLIFLLQLPHIQNVLPLELSGPLLTRATSSSAVSGKRKVTWSKAQSTWTRFLEMTMVRPVLLQFQLLHIPDSWHISVGNWIGQFQWGGHGFTESADNISFKLEGEDEDQVPVLCAMLLNVDGEPIPAEVNLAERIENTNGEFYFGQELALGHQWLSSSLSLVFPCQPLNLCHTFPICICDGE